MNSNLARNIANTAAKNYSKYFYVLFGQTVVNDGIELDLQVVLQEPTYRFDRMGLANRGKYHTLVMVDPDAPVGFWIHQCIYDIPGDNIAYGNVFYDYAPPSPPAHRQLCCQHGHTPKGGVGTGKHRYFCILYEQKGQIGDKLDAGKRAFKKYGDFTRKLKVGLMPKASKFFICEYGK